MLRERLKPCKGTVAWMPSSRVQTSQRPELYSMPLQPACPRHACLHSWGAHVRNRSWNVKIHAFKGDVPLKWPMLGLRSPLSADSQA